MLNPNIIDQLKSAFSKLTENIELLHTESDHEKQTELIEMLEQISSTSDHLSIKSSGETSPAPSFELIYQGVPSGIKFSGIPGGHEFTSLILAILNVNRQGKLPDDVIIKRIESLKGPIHLKTFVSLSCVNCPEVVQSLNIMATFHPDFTHEMVDGGFFQDEVSELGIQGVPSVMDDRHLISSGKSDLSELLGKLEQHYGRDESIENEPINLGVFDVAIVGGGPAGASAAIYSARKGLKTTVVAERLGGQIQDTKGIENMISIPYTEGPELANQLAKHVAEYDIKVLEHRRVEHIENGELKQVILSSGEFFSAKAVIIATGARWRQMSIPGEREYIGKGVAFCPHCDGPFYKGKDIAVVGGGNSGVEAAIDLAGIVSSVTVFERSEKLKADQVLVEKLQSLENVKIIVNAQTSEVVGNGDKVTGIKYQDLPTGETRQEDLEGIFVQIGLVPNSSFITDTVDLNQQGEILIDEKCRTNVEGIYAAGDVSNIPYKQVIIGMGEGAKAALTAFEDLVLRA